MPPPPLSLPNDPDPVPAFAASTSHVHAVVPIAGPSLPSHLRPPPGCDLQNTRAPSPTKRVAFPKPDCIFPLALPVAVSLAGPDALWGEVQESWW